MEQDKIWDHFQNDQTIKDVFANSRARYEAIAAIIKKSDRVLNIGVGRGGLEGLLADKSIRFACLDPSEESISRLRERYSLGEAAQAGYSQSIPFPDASFDVVVMSEVLEHLDDEVIDQTFLEIWRVLRHGGRFIGTVPADEILSENHVICPHCATRFHRWGHVQSFTEAGLRGFLGRKFTNVKIQRQYFVDVASLNWKGIIGWALKRMAVMFGIKGQGETFLFECCIH